MGDEIKLIDIMGFNDNDGDVRENAEATVNNTVAEGCMSGSENLGSTESEEKEAEDSVQNSETEPVAVKKTCDEASDDGITPSDKTNMTDNKASAMGIDYNTLDYVELVNALRDVIASGENHMHIQSQIKIIQSVFYSKLREERKIEREKYIELNGDDNDYEIEPNVYEIDIKRFVKEYKARKAQDREKENADKKENYKKKLAIIEEIKQLVEKEETLNKTFSEFRDLQESWRQIGDVPQANVKDVWRLYHFNVELFYDYVKINRELRELDLKKNYQRKIRICEEVEKLNEEDNVNKAFNELQRFHEQWREIGPVPREVNEEVWERFRAATKVINNKNHEFIGSRREEEKENLEKKEALCARVQILLDKLPEKPKDWDLATESIIAVQKEWKTVGRAPRGDHEKIWKHFRSLCDTFFEKKRDFFSEQRDEKDKNYKLKIELCEKAEGLQDSTDWGRTTDKLIHLQKEWKNIGSVERKVSDKVWKRFRAACNNFFDRKKVEFASSVEEEQKNLEKKLQVIEKVKALRSTGENEQDFEALKELQDEWNAVGFVPFREKDTVYKTYNEALDIAFSNLRINKQEQKIIDLTSKIKGGGLNENQIYREREKLSNKLKHLEEEKNVLDNNVGFFANTKNAESLINEVNRKVQDIGSQILSIKEHLKIIDQSLVEDED